MAGPAQSPYWQDAKRQARRIGQAKTTAGRKRAALTWCRKVKDALR